MATNQRGTQMTKETTYKYTVDLTRLINQRIQHKDVVKNRGNQIFKLKNEITKLQQENGRTRTDLEKIEKDIDKMVIDYSKTQR